MKSTNYSAFCLKLFDKLFLRIKKDQLEDKNLPFVKANIPMSFEEYYSLVLMNVILGFIISLIFALVLFFIFPSNLTGLLALMIPTLTTLSIGLGYLYYPTYCIKMRATNIDLFLPYAINFISSMAVAGISPVEIFQTLSIVAVYGEVQTEAKKIAKEITVMGIDNITALRHAIEVTPSRKFKTFLQGIIGTLQSGSELHIYLEIVADKYMNEDLIERKKDLDLLEVIAEVLVLAAIAFPILLVILLTVMGFFGGSMDFSLTILLFFSFLVLPLVYTTFYFLIKSTSIEKLTQIGPAKNIKLKEFYEQNKPPIFVLLFSMFSVIALFGMIQLLAYLGYLNVNLFLYWDFAFLALLISIGPIGTYSYLKIKKKREMQYRLPDFLMEVGDSLATGMNIFEAVKVAEKGNYGRLNPEIKKMKTQLSWNFSMKEVLFDFADRMKSAIAQRVVIAIDKALIMGGNTPKIFKAAAHEVDQVNQLEHQRRTTMSVYAIVVLVCFFVCLGIIMILNATIFASFFEIQEKQAIMASSVITINIVDPIMLKYTLYSFVFSQSIGAGLLAGFMIDGKLSAGIRISCVLGIISIFVFKILM